MARPTSAAQPGALRALETRPRSAAIDPRGAAVARTLHGLGLGEFTVRHHRLFLLHGPLSETAIAAASALCADPVLDEIQPETAAARADGAWVVDRSSAGRHRLRRR